MANAREEIDKSVQQLAQQREELLVKASLAKLEAREEWGKLEQKWDTLKKSVPQMRGEIGATTDNVVATLRKAAEEVREGYARLRKLL